MVLGSVSIETGEAPYWTTLSLNWLLCSYQSSEWAGHSLDLNFSIDKCHKQWFVTVATDLLS